MKMTPKSEDYLEAVFRLSQRMDTVGVSDVARELKVSVPTVRTAVGRLARIGLLHQPHYGKIILHESGRKLGKEIFEVHTVLRQFLQEILLVDAETAEQEACRMEHGLGKRTLRKLVRFIASLKSCDGRVNGCMLDYQMAVKQERERHARA